jgi:uncharacterized protein (DUF433 family)
MEKIVDILMKRDGLTKQEAIELMEETKQEMMNNMDEAEDIFMEYLGLEMDYIFDFLKYILGGNMKALLVTSFGKDNHAFNVIEKEYDSLQSLVEQINKTQRVKMEYQIFSGRPFIFENLLYSHNAN